MPMIKHPHRGVTAGMRRSMLFGVALAALAAPAAAEDVVHATNAETGIESWETTRGGVYIKLMQITPAQALAFYVARGFDADAANRFAGACVFMTLLRNDAAPGPVAFDLHDWRRVKGKTESALKHRDDWMTDWQRAGVADAARLAFRWAQFPTRHTYQKGDWNQGMQSYGAAPGKRFALRLVWRSDDRIHSTLLSDLRCAPDDR